MSEKDFEDFKLGKTPRGFALAWFNDRNDQECSIQDSSIATEACLWLGVTEYRMHLTQPHAAQLLAYLTNFVDTGTIAQSRKEEVGAIPLTREQLHPYFHELSMRIQNRSEGERDDYEEHLLDELFGKEPGT